MSNPKARILIIDYEPRSIQQLRGPLETAGFQIEVAKDGLVGIETFQRWQPDLTLIEAMLPKRHGFEVCQELKRTPHGTKTPIVIVTSVYKGRKYRTQAIHNYGCDEYLEKPIDDAKLLSTVRQLLDGRVVAVEVEEEMEPPADLTIEDDADPTEREIMSRLDSILPGGNSSMPWSAPAEIPADFVVAGNAADNVIPFEPERPRPRPTEASAPAARAVSTPAVPSKPTPARALQSGRRVTPGGPQRSEPAPRPARPPVDSESPAVSQGFLKWMGITVLGLVIVILVLIVIVS